MSRNVSLIDKKYIESDIFKAFCNIMSDLRDGFLYELGATETQPSCPHTSPCLVHRQPIVSCIAISFFAPVSPIRVARSPAAARGAAPAAC